ncbi:MAG: hypothetical protein KatS3mg106_602 [Gemmataceae bacterium]|jgi:Ca-activated chloride channel family protein|nr:MAG: hypothetical protein KatS3mg106_602 [Gemmataceae bacterium]
MIGRRILRGALAGILLFLLWRPLAFGQETQGGVEITQVDISRFPEVTIFFKVTGPNGQPLRQLHPEDIELFEDGQAVQAERFLGMGSFSVTTALLVDCSGSMADRVEGGGTKLDAAKAACRAFLAHSRPRDVISLIRFNTTVTSVQPLGAPLPDVQRSVDTLIAEGGTAWRDAVADALSMLATHQGRRNIVLLTDGQDNSSRHSITSVIREARKLQIPVYAIALGEAHQVDELELRHLAEETGGRYLLMPTAEHLARLYADMSKSLQEEFGVSYQSHRPTPDGTRRAIRLIVRAAGVTLSGGTEYLERHLLNIDSHWGVFLFWGAILGLCYVAPFLRDLRQQRAFRQACRDAFQDHIEVRPIAAADVPTVELQVHVHPLALLRDEVPRLVSVRLDTSLRVPEPSRLLHQPLHLIILLDLSASMEGERLQAARAAIRSLLAGMADWDSFCLVGFSDNARIVVPPVRVGPGRSEIVHQLDNLLTGTTTLLGPALEKVEELLPPLTLARQRRSCCVVLSDGKIEDRTRALEVCTQLVKKVEFYALGLGADYDHEFLAQVCGGKGKVDHLDTPQDATDAFQRLVNLYGHTVTARTRLCFRTCEGVILQRVTAQRHAEELLIADDQTVSIGDLAASGTLSYLAEFQVTPKVCGPLRLAECTIVFDLPGYGKSGCTVRESIWVPVTEDPSQANIPNPEVVRVARLIQASKLAEKAEEALRSGNIRLATQKLKQVTRQLDDLGEHDKAEAVSRLLERIEADPANTDLAIKRVRGTTKRLTE